MPEPNQTGLTDNAAGGIAYITPIPAIVFLLVEPYNKNSYIRFHAWQSILLGVVWIILRIVATFTLRAAMTPLDFVYHSGFWSMLALFWSLVWLAFLIVALVCLFNAFNGKRFKLPVLGAIAEKQANK
ncbi:MAG: hypothetical protein WCE75_16580 [Terracidiphilus sp.]